MYEFYGELLTITITITIISVATISNSNRYFKNWITTSNRGGIQSFERGVFKSAEN